MTPERWARIKEIFGEAMEKPEAERGAYLDSACGPDEELRGEVEKLLVGSEEASLRSPAAGLVTVTAEFVSGEMLAQYRIEAKLGEGGMGAVYRAYDTRLRRQVALKVLLPDPFADPERKPRLLREARAASALNHPNIVTIHEIGTERGQDFIAMEYVEGRSLSQIIPSKGLPVARALDYAVQIADALAQAHAAGVVHRDLKPGNVMVNAAGRIKLLDFGLARKMRLTDAESTTLTVQGDIAGTPPYMSPEQAEGKELDARSDIFSFGAVLYEMISGSQAFRGKSTISVIAALLEREPEPLCGIPDELRHILSRALRKDPARRWQHMDDLRLALEDVQPALERSEPKRPNLVSRWRLQILAAVSVAALAVAGYLAWRYAGFSQSGPAYRFEQVTDEPGQELNPSLSPDGRSVVYASKATGNWDIYLLRVGGQNPANLTRDSAADDTQPAFSPAGEQIAFRSERDGGGIFIMGATGESVRRLTDFCYFPAWSPDGKEIACSTANPHRPEVRESTNSRIFVIDVEMGKRRLVSGGVQDAVQPNWSPDGRRIAFWSMREGIRDILTVSREGGSPIAVTNDDPLDWNPVWSPDGKFLYFSSDRGGAMNLWRVAMSASGQPSGEPEPVRVPSTYAASISFSRDGRRLAYANCQRSSNIHRVEFDPERERIKGAPRAVTRGIKETLYPAFSRDGKWIAFTLLGLHEDLALVRPDGSDLRRIMDDHARDRAPRWSPGGDEIVFMSRRGVRFEIWAIRPDGSGLRQVTEDSPRGGVWYPAWSPDGRRLSYSLPGEMSYIIDAGKSWRQQQPRPARAGVPEGSWLWLNDWAHDGTKIAGTLLKLDGGALGIGAFNLETKKFEPYTSFGQFPRWLPDGRRLLFHARGRIFLADSSGKRTQEILSVKEGSINPYFDVSWDGRMIAFSLESMDSDIWIMSHEY